MKNDLLDKMNLIDPGYIEEAERFEAQKLSVKAKKTAKRLYFEYAALAACLIAGLATGYRALTQRTSGLPLGVVRQTYSESASTFAESATPLFMISLVFLLISAALVFLIIKEKKKQSN